MKRRPLLAILVMKKMMVLFAMALALQVATAQTASGGSSRKKTEMNQKIGKQTANNLIVLDQMKEDQAIKQHSEMSYGSAGSNSGQWRGLIILLKLIFILTAFASRSDSAGND